MLRVLRALCLSGSFSDLIMSPVACCARSRLETNAEQWTQLLKTLKELIDWSTQKQQDIKAQQPVGGDVNSVTEQYDNHQVSGDDDNDTNGAHDNGIKKIRVTGSTFESTV